MDNTKVLKSHPFRLLDKTQGPFWRVWVSDSTRNQESSAGSIFPHLSASRNHSSGSKLSFNEELPWQSSTQPPLVTSSRRGMQTCLRLMQPDAYNMVLSDCGFICNQKTSNMITGSLDLIKLWNTWQVIGQISNG